MFKKLLFTLILFFTLISQGWTVNYYVDTASSGGDGTTTATSGTHAAFATIAAVNAATFAGDDFIYLKKDCVWVEGLVTPSSGTANHPITFDAYGTTGANPRLQLAVSRAGAAWTKTAGKTNVYQSDFTGYTLPTTYGTVWYGTAGHWMSLQASVDNVDANAGSCYAASNLIYIHTIDGSDPITNGDTYYVTVVACGVLTNTKDYITIKNIDVYYAATVGFGTLGNPYLNYSSHINISDCNVYFCRSDTFLAAGVDINFTRCKVYYSTYKGFISFYDGSHTPATDGVNFTDCEYATNTVWGSNTPTAFYGEGELNTTITRGIISGDCYQGVHIGRYLTSGSRYYTVNGLLVTGTVTNRIVVDDYYTTNIVINGVKNTTAYTLASGYAMQFQLASGVEVKNCNILMGAGTYAPIGMVVPVSIHNNILQGGLVSIWPTATPTGITVYNNVISGSTYGLFYGAGVGITLNNNIFLNVGTDIYPPNPATGTVSDYNCSYGQTSWANGYATRALWYAASGQDEHSISSNPLFVSASDWHLQANLSAISPCIDAGVDVGLTSDFEGNPIPRGAAQDIGAYEFVGSRFGVVGVWGASGRFGVPGY